MDAEAVAAAISALPQVETAVPVSFRDAEFVSAAGQPKRRVQFIAADPQARPMWTVVTGRGLPAGASAAPPLLVNRTVAATQRVAPGSTLSLRGTCGPDQEALPPMMFTIVGIAEF